MVTKTQIETGLASYIDTEMMPKIHLEPFKQFALATVMSIAVKRVGRIIEALEGNQMLSTLGVFEDGQIDIDILAEASKKNMPKEGLKINVPYVGVITLHPDDVDTLHRLITGV